MLIFEILSLSIYKFIIGLRNPEESQTRLSYLIAFIFLSSTFGLSVFSLFVLQLFLIFKGLTTNEYLRGTFNNIDNPFNDGCFSNLCSFLKNESGITNISFDYLVEKEKYDNEMALTSQDENRKNSEFSLEMSRIKSNETLKIDSEEEMKNSRENSSMHKKLMKEPNGI